MKFKDLKQGQFFYMGERLFVKRDDLDECTISAYGSIRNAVYMDSVLIGYPCFINLESNVCLANVIITHTPQKTFKDVPVNTPFMCDGQSWFKLNDKVAVPSKSIEGVSEFGTDVVVTF